MQKLWRFGRLIRLPGHKIKFDLYDCGRPVCLGVDHSGVVGDGGAFGVADYGIAIDDSGGDFVLAFVTDPGVCVGDGWKRHSVSVYLFWFSMGEEIGGTLRTMVGEVV